MTRLGRRIADFVSSELRSSADPTKAAPMGAYMKTDMPFYGVQKPGRVQIVREIKKRFRVTTRRDYERAVLMLWRKPHREEKYVAIQIARIYPAFIDLKSMRLYERLVREGAWWDLVDEVAIKLVGSVLREHRGELRARMDTWVKDDDLWIRRSAIISQVGHRDQTDHRSLFRYCLERAIEKEFFIRKAIGWALRDYSYTSPDRVRTFLRKHRERLSPLSVREGAKYLERIGEAP